MRKIPIQTRYLNVEQSHGLFFMKANIIIHKAQKTESYFGKPMI